MPHEFIPTLAAIAAINVLGWLTPGPNMLVIISHATRSRKAGYITALGVVSGGFIWALLALSGVAIIFELFPGFVFFLRLLGAGYLIWIGYKSIRYAGQSAASAPAARHPRQTFLRGFLVVLTNPKAIIFFGSILTALTPPDAPLALLVSIIALTVTQGLIQHFITAMIFSAPPVQRWFKATHRTMQRLFGTLYIALGLGVAVDAAKRL